LEIEWYEDLVSHIHQKYPQITIHGFSAIEIDYIAKRSRISVDEVLKRLQKKGLSSIPGAGAEILSDRVRDIIAPKKIDTERWLEIHREAHKIGMKSTATMMLELLKLMKILWNILTILENFKMRLEDLERSFYGHFRAKIQNY